VATRTVSVNLVANVGQYVGGMNKAAGATLRLGETSSASTKKAQGGFDLASKGALVMGAAVVAGLGMAISKSMEFEKSMSAVGAATGATAGTLGDLREAAMRAGADTQYSATEAAGAITEMAKAGVSAKDIMGGGLKGALSLAAAGQLDVADAAGIASVAMTQFSLSGAQLPHVADLLAAGAGKAMGSVGDLGAALNQSGLIASAAGLSIEETTGTLSAFASAGLIGSDAGTSFKTMLQALQAPSGKAAELMSDLGLNMYDAQGNMLGVSEMAGQLQAHLSGLTEEQRNSALATIFGSDAVRAANVLYKEGAAGIADWTSKVNDQGYAAKQAAALNDNLSGDLERLGGSFDTLMISLGSGAQGPLRDLVQMLGGLVDGVNWAVGAFADLPGPVKVALAAMAGWVALRGPLGALFSRVAVGIVSTVTSMGMATGATTAFGIAAGTARIALMSLLTTAAPLAAVAGIAYAITGIIDFATAASDARDEVRGMWDAVADARGSAQVDAINGTIDQLKSKVTDLRGEIENRSIWDKLWSGPFTDQGVADSLDVYQAALDRAEAAQLKVDIGAGALAERFGMTSDAVLSLASKYNIDLTGSVSEVNRLFQNFYSMEFGTTPTKATVAVSKAMDEAKSSVDDAKQAVDSFKLSLDILTGANVSMIQVESAFQSAVADAKDAVKDLNGHVLDGSGKLNLQSEAGRKAADVLLNVRDSGNDLIATLINQGASTDKVRAKDAELRASFIKSAQQMGISESAAKDLANQILGIPSERQTKIDADTKAANDKIAATQRGIDNLHGKTVEVKVKAAGRFIINPQGGLQEFAEGGYTGAGHKYQPAGIVHAGEFVVPQHRVNALGGPGAVGSLVGMPGYADGGYVLANNISWEERNRLIAAGWKGNPNDHREALYAPAQVAVSFDDTHLQAAMASVASAMKNAEPADGVGYSGRATLGSGALVGFGRWLQSMGARVSEHPAFGGVTPGAHVRGSKHYSGRAIDVNTRAGTSSAEQHELAPLVAAARAAGFQTIFMAPGHYNHAHIASYKTGTPFVPQDGLAYLHQGERVVPREQNMRSREFSGSSGWGGSVVRNESRSQVINISAPESNARVIATKVRDVQRDLEFLHG